MPARSRGRAGNLSSSTMADNGIIHRLLALAEHLSRIAVWCGGAMLLVAAAIIAVEVLLRKLFLVSLGGADEIASYALAIGTSWALPFALLRRAHIRVDALYLRLPRALAAVLDVLSLVALGAFTAVMTRFAYDVWETSLSFGSTANTPLGTPLWIPQGLWILGFALFLATIFLLLIGSVSALIQGDRRAVSRLAGTRTVAEDLSDEVASLAQGSAAPGPALVGR